MVFRKDPAHGGRISLLYDFNACLNLFRQRGCHEVDPAKLYVAHWKELGLKMTRKWYLIMPGAFKADIIKAKLEESLRELKTGSVDIFCLHAADRAVPLAETWRL